MQKLTITKVLATSALLGIFMAGPSVYAADNTQTDLSQYLGISPDSPWYFLQTWEEKIQLNLAPDAQAKSQLLISDANRRLAEAQLMASKGNTTETNTLMQAYSNTLAQAQNTVSEAVNDTNTTDSTKSDLTTALDDSANLGDQLDNSVTGDLTDATKSDLQNNVEGAQAVANVVKGIDPTVVQTLKSENLGYGEIAKVVALSQMTGKSTDEIASMLQSGQGFGDIAQQLGVTPKQLAQTVKDNHLKANGHANEHAVNQPDTQAPAAPSNTTTTAPAQPDATQPTNTSDQPATTTTENTTQQEGPKAPVTEPSQPVEHAVQNAITHANEHAQSHLSTAAQETTSHQQPVYKHETDSQDNVQEHSQSSNKHGDN